MAEDCSAYLGRYTFTELPMLVKRVGCRDELALCEFLLMHIMACRASVRATCQPVLLAIRESICIIKADISQQSLTLWPADSEVTAVQWRSLVSRVRSNEDRCE